MSLSPLTLSWTYGGVWWSDPCDLPLCHKNRKIIILLLRVRACCARFRARKHR